MNDQLFIRLRGRIQGPFAADQLHQLARRGQFSRSHEISTDGVNWTRATTRPELFPPAGMSAAVIVAPEVELEPPRAAAPVVPPPADVWFYHQLSQNHGPIDFTHLQYLASSGQIAADDMVWKDGLPEWLPAGRVPGLMRPVGTAQPVQASPMFVTAMQPAGANPSEFPRVSGLAVASLVLGLLWIGGLGSLLAVIFGAVALHQIRLARGRLTGTGLAVAGLVLGIVMLGLQVLVTIIELQKDRY
jgi:hypothetical protein